MDPRQAAEEYLNRSTDLRPALGVASNAVLTLCDLAQGEHNANFVIACDNGRRWALRLNYSSQLGLENQIEYEYAALQALAGSGRTPKPVFADGSRSVCPQGVLVEEFLEGVLLDLENDVQLHETARVLADIHAAPVPEACPLFSVDRPLTQQLETARGLFDVYRSSAFAEYEATSRIEGFFAKAERAVADLVRSGSERCEHACIINTEAVPSHFLLAETGKGRMVDWEKAIVADPAQDVAYFLSPTSTIWDSDVIFDEARRAAFIETYAAAVAGRFALDGFMRRLPLFVMTNALIGLSWSCHALVDYNDPDRPLKNEKTRRKLDIYRSREFLDIVEDICFS